MLCCLHLHIGWFKCFIASMSCILNITWLLINFVFSFIQPISVNVFIIIDETTLYFVLNKVSDTAHYYQFDTR